jgi:ubiquinol-cytochrome c reductase cytochrome c subunit
VAAASLLASGSAGAASGTPKSPLAGYGYHLYGEYCLSCHGANGGGRQNQTSTSAGAGPGREQTQQRGIAPSLHGVGALAADFYLRTGYMPLSNPHDEPGGERVLFTEKELRSLVGYVAALGGGPAVPHPNPGAGSIAQGTQLFTLHCSGCHQEEARGGFVTGARVPPLQSVSATQIAEAVRIGPYLMPRFPASEISDAQLNSLIKYVLSTQHPPNRGGWGIGNLGPIPEGMVTWWIAAPLLLLSCLAVGRRMRRR